jgi:hypothetical protein
MKGLNLALIFTLAVTITLGSVCKAQTGKQVEVDLNGNWIAKLIFDSSKNNVF